MFPLDMALEQYKYQSREYYKIKENIGFFEHLFVLYVEDSYNIILQQQQQQEQEEA